MIVCLFAAVLLVFVALMPGELVVKSIQSTGIQDVPEPWQSSSQVEYYISSGYFLSYFLSFFAVGQFIWTAVRRQRYDVYGNLVED
jgi:hypothetical protein